MSPETSTQARCVRHAEGETHPVIGDPMRFIMTAAHTGGAYAISEVDTQPGGGAPPHIHHREDEAFYVLEGTFEVTVDGTTHQLETGDFAHAPRGAVRAFTNVTDQPGRLLILHIPGAAADFYIGMGQLPFPPDPKDMAALGAQYDIELVQPA